MSESSKRGKRLEQEVAALLRRKMGARVARDKRSGAGATTKTDIKDWYQETPFDIECKDHETIKVKEWWRQADAAASYTRMATLVFRADEHILATVKFEDLVNLAVELRDLRAERDALVLEGIQGLMDEAKDKMVEKIDTPGFLDVKSIVADKKSKGAEVCRAGHLADQWGFCLMVDCKYSRGYRPPKKKRSAE